MGLMGELIRYDYFKEWYFSAVVVLQSTATISNAVKPRFSFFYQLVTTIAINSNPGNNGTDGVSVYLNP